MFMFRNHLSKLGRGLAVIGLLGLAACEQVPVGPDPRDEFSARNVNKTLVTYVNQLGTQAVYLAPNGELYLWTSASSAVQRGSWKYDLLATGAATTYQGAGGINHPVQELDTGWGLCFRYRDAAGNIVRRPEGGDWNCALFADYEALVIDRAEGDIFSLGSGTAPAAMPPGERLTGSELEALS